nr:hypothetical protein BaRGS_030835 [Batillaria attramentaria]
MRQQTGMSLNLSQLVPAFLGVATSPVSTCPPYLTPSDDLSDPGLSGNTTNIQPTSRHYHRYHYVYVYHHYPAV